MVVGELSGYFLAIKKDSRTQKLQMHIKELPSGVDSRGFSFFIDIRRIVAFFQEQLTRPE